MATTMRLVHFIAICSLLFHDSSSSFASYENNKDNDGYLESNVAIGECYKTSCKSARMHKGILIGIGVPIGKDCWCCVDHVDDHECYTTGEECKSNCHPLSPPPLM